MNRIIRTIKFCVLVAVMFICFPEGISPGQVTPIGEVPQILETKLHRDISLDLRDMDVVDVYRFLALRGGFNTSISRNISGRVTLYLKNVTIRDALDIISISNDLAYKVVGDNIIHVMTEAEYQSMYGRRFSDRREVEIVRLNYVKPAYALETLSNLKSEVGRVVIDEDTGAVVMIDIPGSLQRMVDTITQMDQGLDVRVFDLQYADAQDVLTKLRREIDNRSVGTTEADTRSNQLIVRAFPHRMSEVEKIISALDKKTKAVLIDVRILRVVLNPEYKRGVDWKNFITNASNIVLAGTFPTGHAMRVFDIGAIGRIGVAKTGQDGLTVNIDMLEEVLSTKVLANPRILVTENEEAKIHIGDKLAYVTTTTIGTGESQRVNEEIHYLNVGVQFVVTPRINEDGFVTMRIKPEVSTRTGTLRTPQGSEVPLINTTTLETEVIVKDMHTIIMAGLKQDEQIQEESGVTGLQNIPFLGNAFRHKQQQETMTEIVILITPRIVTGMEEYSEQQRLKRTLITEYKDYHTE